MSSQAQHALVLLERAYREGKIDHDEWMMKRFGVLRDNAEDRSPGIRTIGENVHLQEQARFFVDPDNVEEVQRWRLRGVLLPESR